MIAMTAALLLLLADPTVKVEPLPFDAGAVIEEGKAEIKVKEGEQTITYRGMPLRALLAGQLKGPNAMGDLRALSDAVVLVRASDGYQAAFSAAEIAMDTEGSRYFLAGYRDGKQFDAKQGPVKLIAPGDPQHVRWVRMVEAVELVRLPKAKKKGGENGKG